MINYSIRMLLRRLHSALLVLGFALTLAASAQTPPAYRYLRVGSPSNIAAAPHPGYALMGGGTDLDQAFRFLCDRAAGGDLLVLRATGDDYYNPYIHKLCHLNSVATLVIPNRAAALDPFVAQTIAGASALFIAGGDQANYINFWQRTPVQVTLNAAIQRGVPIGGTSAGLAVLGEWAYTAQGDQPDDADLDAKLAMADPFGPRITLNRNFLQIPILKAVITDTHFARRNRMGRLLVFLARLNEPDGKPLPAPGIRGIGVDQGAAILLDPEGHATIVGHGSAYFISAAHATTGTQARQVVEAGKPLSFGPFVVDKVAPGHSFNLHTWSGDAAQYNLSIDRGTIRSTSTSGVY